ncbi:MAG: transcriptional repressor [Oscillospiraceae bacterium]|nr:transcriptional repressor [Oscillospiraceae bacterium]
MKTTYHSQKREAILKKLRSTKSHPSAEWIYNELKAEYPGIGIATVYRNLKKFREDGTIQSVATVGGHERYDADISNHIHFICDTCGEVSDVDFEQKHIKLESHLQQKGYSVAICTTNLRGKCNKCA